MAAHSDTARSHDDRLAELERGRSMETAETDSLHMRSPSTDSPKWHARVGTTGFARRTVGMALLFLTVCLWTLSNFLASSIFSDGSYNKPFFLTYANSSVFAVALLPMFLRYLAKNGLKGLKRDVKQIVKEEREARRSGARRVSEDVEHHQRLLAGEGLARSPHANDEKLSVRETIILSMEFSALWTSANYFAAACFEYTSVASGTIFLSTSSVWTLVLGALFNVEAFSAGKLVGVLGSLLGVGLVATVDLSGTSDENRGTFPHKTTGELVLGNAMAFLSAVIYGVYITMMKKRVGDEEKVNMRLFFGLVGVWTMIFMWPMFVILHFTGIETFAMPSTGTVWTVIVANSLSSFVSDICWAYAMLLTTPLIVTVGLSLNIPLAVIGQMFQYHQYASITYWVGAAVVLVSFAATSHQSQPEGPSEPAGETEEERICGTYA